MSAGGGRGPLPAAVLLDQDGTIVNTEPVWMAAETAIVEEHGGTWSHELGLQMVGNPLLVSASIMIEQAHLPMTPEEVVAELLEHVRRSLQEQGVPWLPGIPAFLGRLHDAGIPVALVTSSYRRVVEVVAARAPHGGFATVVAGDDVSEPKPAPEPYLVAARRLGVDIADCLVVEDSPSGITAGLAAGATVVGIPCVLPVEPRPGLNRVNSPDELDLATMRGMMAGEVVDTVGSR
ncbi:HAD family hydrolase [Actinomyces polynesiensis]|uniref:HAD family hydrolase n=1 Tax=Actinomyces polynesiensis TaxID=1325934 RepID=UPI0006937418|nr:HAD family phosphatase [Actinomyces polynesiensis]